LSSSAHAPSQQVSMVLHAGEQVAPPADEADELLAPVVGPLVDDAALVAPVVPLVPLVDKPPPAPADAPLVAELAPLPAISTVELQPEAAIIAGAESAVITHAARRAAFVEESMKHLVRSERQETEARSGCQPLTPRTGGETIRRVPIRFAPAPRRATLEGVVE
jgi:hypothetical protein